MTASELLALLPLLILTATTVVVLLVIAFYRHHALTAILTLVGLGAALVTLPLAAQGGARPVTALLVMDPYVLIYIGLLLVASLTVTVLSYHYLKSAVGPSEPSAPTAPASEPEEFYLLLLLATLGGAVLAASRHFASFFLGLEILSIALYTLIAYPRVREQGIEAGLKYLILAGTSAGFLLFGMALVYAELGTMDFTQMAALHSLRDLNNNLLLAGFTLILVGIGFKLAIVPFHLWTPDVYQGAPAPVTAFVATVSKGAMVALLLRDFGPFEFHYYSPLFTIFSILAIASMLIGNLLGLLQSNVKRLLAYSSIAHLGYILVAFQASGPLAVTAVTIYVAAYFVTTLGAFGVVTVLSRGAQEAETLEHYRGLIWRRPWLGALLTLMLLSLAGIPLTAGFIGKFYVVTAAAGSALWPLVIVLVIGSTIGLFYYLRVIVALYSRPADEEIPAMRPTLSWAEGLTLAVLALLLLGLGAFPAPLIQLIQQAVAGPV